MAEPKPKLIFFSSIDDAEDAKYADLLAQDPRIRLKETVELIRKVYSNHPKPNTKEKKLYFP